MTSAGVLRDPYMPKSKFDCLSTGKPTMKSEIDSAVNFLFKILRNGTVGLSADQMMSFRRCLEATLLTRYQDHWFPDRPQRGSAYRCVRIVNRKLDHMLASAANAAGVPEPLLERLLPTELTLWVDPDEVSHRINLFSFIITTSGYVNLTYFSMSDPGQAKSDKRSTNNSFRVSMIKIAQVTFF